MNITITEQPESPVTIDEARHYCRGLEGPEDDALFDILITAARQEIETLTGRALGEQTITFTAERFPRLGNVALLPRAPLVAIEKVEYIAPGGELATFTDYEPITATEPGGLYAPNGFPSTAPRPDAVRITYRAGGPVPADLIKAVLWLTSHAYEHRDPAIVGTSVAELPFALLSVIRLNKIDWRWPR